MDYIDLRSDTVTEPTQSMREAMATAVVGDDVFGDDPTVNELERYAAALVAKEAALFVPSGTFANQLALFTHCERSQEVVLDDDCHIIQHEAGAGAVIAGVQFRTVTGKTEGGSSACLNPDAFEAKIRTHKDMHEPQTGLLCLENARACGKVLPLSFMEDMSRIARRHNVPIHLDGARVFNAATALGTQAEDIAQHVDSLMFCLSKGLCSPVGSMLAGSADFIEKARYKRKLMGGAMRQAGILAAAGLISLQEMRLRLQEDHDNAVYLAQQLATIDDIDIVPADTEINMVFCTFRTADTALLVEYLKQHGILAMGAFPNGTMRFVTHHGITKEHVDKVIGVIKQFLA